MTRRLFPLLLLLTPWASTAQPPAVVRDGPVAPPAAEVGTLAVGTIFEAPGGELMMLVDPPQDLSGGESNVRYGVKAQPQRQYVSSTYTVEGYGTFTLTDPGPVYVVDLRTGDLFLMDRGTWARPVTAARVTFRPGERVPEPPPEP